MRCDSLPQHPQGHVRPGAGTVAAAPGKRFQAVPTAYMPPMTAT